MEAVRSSTDLQGLVEIRTVQWDEPHLLGAIRDGQIDIGLVMADEIESARDVVGPQPAAMFNHPLIFEDLEELALVENSWLGDAALAELARANLLGLAFWNGGLTQFATNRSLEDLDDLSGRKIMTTSKGGFKVIQTLGASPLETASSDVYPALESGVVDAAEVSIESALSGGGAFTHLTEINYRAMVAVLVVNRDRWHSLPEQARVVLGALSRAAGHRSTTFVLTHAEEARERLREQDIMLASFDPSARQRFREVSRQAWEEEQPEEIVPYLTDAFRLIDEASQDRRSRPVAPTPRREGANELEILFATDRNDEQKKTPDVPIKLEYRLDSLRMPDQRYCGTATYTLDPRRPLANEDEKYFKLTNLFIEPWGNGESRCSVIRGPAR